MTDDYMALYSKLTRLQWLLQRQHLQRHAERGPAADPTRGQGRVLAMLKMQPEISTRDLSYLLGIRQQSLNELLGKLEKAGYVARTPSEADKRVVMASLTEKGRAAQSGGPDLSRIFGCLSETEGAAFSEYLDRIIAALEDELGLEAETDERFAWMDDFRERMGDDHMSQWLSSHGHQGFWDAFARGQRPGPDDDDPEAPNRAGFPHRRPPRRRPHPTSPVNPQDE